MQRSLLSVLLLCAAFLCHAQSPKYARAKVHLDGTHTIAQLAQLGIAVDHGAYKEQTFFRSDLSSTEIETIKAAGFGVDIEIDDVSQHYVLQNKLAAKTTGVSCNEPPLPVPSHFQLGSYGGYFTYAELMNALDQMRQLYPSLISIRQPVGNFITHDGNSLYWVRISSNPTVNQPAKPQILYTALHHAREPGSISQMIFYLWYLLENYSTNDQVKAIVDNAELYFIPCLNPDGYLYNQSTNPQGGGMWRKNRRNNQDGTYGVDLNRNYGQFWAYDNSGSSPFTGSDTYRGPAAFSEPETKAVKWFAEQHHFSICLNYHAFQNVLIYPWGHVPNFLTPDSTVFSCIGDLLTEHNDYRHGVDNDMLGYLTNGESDSWMYGDVSGKPKVYAMTPEVGASNFGFYPPISQIIPDCKNNLLANVNAAALLLPYVKATATDRKIITQKNGYLHYHLKRLGLDDNGTYTVSVIPLDSWLTIPGSPQAYTGLALAQEVVDSMAFSLSSSIGNNQLVRYILRVNNGYYDLDDTVSFYHAQYHALIEPSTNSLNDWNSSGWGVCVDAFSAPASLQSSPDGASYYEHNSWYTLTTKSQLDLTHSLRAYLYFYAKWYTELEDDHVSVRAIDAATSVSQDLCGIYTRPHPDANTALIYDGIHPNWVREEINLQDHLGKKINLEYFLYSDGGILRKGFYLDDVSIVTVEDGPAGIPGAPGEADVDIYPNPADDAVTIAYQRHSNEVVQGGIYDCIGRKVKSFVCSGDKATIGLADVSPGVYVVKLYNGDTMLKVEKINITH